MAFYRHRVGPVQAHNRRGGVHDSYRTGIGRAVARRVSRHVINGINARRIGIHHPIGAQACQGAVVRGGGTEFNIAAVTFHRFAGRTIEHNDRRGFIQHHDGVGGVVGVARLVSHRDDYHVRALRQDGVVGRHLGDEEVGAAAGI